jgi:hypothetical protein
VRKVAKKKRQTSRAVVGVMTFDFWRLQGKKELEGEELGRKS